jgi:2-hydroxy-3-keto-5-methylthiopentenyl-1-phosphate phosphatase
VAVLNQWETSQTFKIAIGDSLTDFGMARVADFVFAREALAEQLTQEGRAFMLFDTFEDIQQVLQRLL